MEQKEKIIIKSNIIEWLYINDGIYENKNAWRVAFVDMLTKQLGMTEMWTRDRKTGKFVKM